jgi:hypothetical protein
MLSFGKSGLTSLQQHYWNMDSLPCSGRRIAAAAIASPGKAQATKNRFVIG